MDKAKKRVLFDSRGSLAYRVRELKGRSRLDKYELLLENFTEYIHNFDDEILIRGYDLNKMKGIIEKAENEA